MITRLACRMRIKLFFLLLLLFQCQITLASSQLSLFVPRDSPFWQRIGEFAQAASDGIDANLKIYNADNSPQKMLDQVEQAAQQGSDGILFMNYAGVGESILKIAEKYQIPALLFNSALDNPKLLPRVHYRQWIGSIIPDDREAGIRLATQLIERAKQHGADHFNVLAYIGLPESRAHVRRFEGLKSVIEARNDTTLVQSLSHTKDNKQAKNDFLRAYQQHPDINIVWSYSDKFVVSAAQAYAGLSRPDKLAFGGIDWGTDSLASVQKGIIDFDLGGHIFDAAQGVIMLDDYLHGNDFVDERLQWKSAMIIASQKNIATIQRLLADPASIDYRALSKTHNPKLLQYRFALDTLPLRQAIKLSLTKSQQQWLQAHPNLSVGAMESWPPFDYVDEDGNAVGIGADIVKELNHRLGFRLHIVSGKWNDIYQATAHKKLDMIMDITPKPSREPLFNFTSLYLDVPHIIIARKDQTFLRTEDDLQGMVLALEEGFGSVKYFRDKYPGVTLKLYTNTEKALEAVSRGDADAYAGNRVVALYLIEKMALSNLRAHGRMKKTGSQLAIGTRKDYVILRDILQLALDDIGPQKLQQIRNRWIFSPQGLARTRQPFAPSLVGLKLTPQEISWLKAHEQITLGVDPGWRPLEYIDESGQYQGLSSAYMHYFSRKLGLQIKPPQNIPWSAMLQKLRHQEVDVAPMISATQARKNYLNFTQHYITLPLVIFNRRGETLLGGLADLKDKKIAIIKDYSVNNFLQRDFPQIERVTVNSVSEGLDALSTRKADAYIDVLAVGGYQIAAGGYTNLQVASTTPYKLDFAIGVRKDWPQLIGIFNKVLDSLSEQQKNEFLRQWLSVRYAQKTDYTFAFWVLGASLIIILLFFMRAREMNRVNTQLELANAEVEKSSRFKSQFLANMSHEIRTPMNAIIGLGHLLSRTRLDIKQSDYIHKLQKSAQQLLGLIDDILDISKIEAGQLNIEHIEFNLEQLLNDLAEVAQIRLADKDIEFIYYLDANVPIIMLGDPFRLNQVLTNLVSNAIKFTDHGNILLKVCVIERSETSVKLKFSVADNGIGIEPDKLDTLFEPFTQEDGSTTRRYGGTGLGLSISRQLTHLMDGEMKVESSKGRGSTFYFTLPFELPDITGKNILLKLPDPDLRGLNVLLVDDNKQTLEVLEYMLRSMTFNVECASNAQQALALLEQHTDFDIVLLDWRMPDKDGFATATEIHQRVPDHRLPIIIMMTAYGREAAEHAAFAQTEIDGFLIKPVTPSQIFDAIIRAYQASPAAPLSIISSQPSPSKTLTGTVLLAEDNPINQQVAAEILQQMGLKVHICENGMEVVSSLPGIQPDLILMDIQMPFMDGYQATQEIRSMEEYARLPIIAMTANAMVEDIEKSLQSGMNAHISKPVDPQLLYDTVKKYLPANKVAAQPIAATSGATENWPEHVKGLNITQGIKQVGGNEALFQKLVIDFWHNYQDLPQKLQRYLQQGAIDKADRLLHTIKGVSANIGATELNKIVSQINDEIHQQQEIKTSSIDQLNAVCTELFDSLHQLAGHHNPTSPPSHEPPQRLDPDKILQLLRHNDAHARKLLEDNLSALQTLIGNERAQQVLRLVGDYEFEQARRLLEKALEESR
jgi:polar amino acid transport system substrate-binding protein